MNILDIITMNLKSDYFSLKIHFQEISRASRKKIPTNRKHSTYFSKHTIFTVVVFSFLSTIVCVRSNDLEMS